MCLTAGPRLLTDAAGNARIFWAQNTGVFASRFASGGEPTDWTEPRAIASVVDGAPPRPVVPTTTVALRFDRELYGSTFCCDEVALGTEPIGFP